MYNNAEHTLADGVLNEHSGIYIMQFTMMVGEGGGVENWSLGE